MTSEYEYKAPSYRLHEPRMSPEDLSAAPARFSFSDGRWVPVSPLPGARPGRARVLIAGDLLCQEGMTEAFRTKAGRFDFSLCFEAVRPVLQAADLVIGNLETPVDECAPYRGEILTHEGPFFCNAPVEYLAALRNAGFDCLTTANNHTLDAGVHGLFETIDNARSLGFIQTGTFREGNERFAVVEVAGITVGIAAFSAGFNRMDRNLRQEARETLLNMLSVDRARSVLERMREKGVEVALCIPHWGTEYSTKVAAKQQELARKLVDMGYDAIIGAHPHVLQPFEVVRGVPVAYSIGNFISHLNLKGEARKDASYTVLAELELERGANGKVAVSTRFIPCFITRDAEGAPFAVIAKSSNIEIPSSMSSDFDAMLKRVQQIMGAGGDVLDLSAPVTDGCDVGGQAWRRQAENLNEPTVDEELLLAAKAMRKVAREAKARYKGKADYVVARSAVYRKFSDHAELVSLFSSSSVISLPSSVRGLDVTRVCDNAADDGMPARVIYLGKHVREIGNNAFRGLLKLESVRMFTEVERIGDRAFADCPKLTGVIVSQGVKSIGSECFARDGALLSVKIPPSVREIAADAFKDSDTVTVYGEKGSFVERFAKSYRVPFFAMLLPRKLDIGLRARKYFYRVRAVLPARGK